MLKGKELAIIIAVALVFGLTISLIKSLEIFLYALAAIFLVIIINILAKKVTAFFLDSEIETSLWEIKRYGFSPNKKFKKPFPAGVVFPIVVAILSFGYFYWFASLVFDVKQKVYRASRRLGLYTFSEVTEYHIGLIAAGGIIANLIFAIIGYLTGFEEFAKLNIYFAAYNLIPISDLDGNKVFFGSIILWSFLAAVSLIALGYALLLI
jgi:hypothetical protein